RPQAVGAVAGPHHVQAAAGLHRLGDPRVGGADVGVAAGTAPVGDPGLVGRGHVDLLGRAALGAAVVGHRELDRVGAGLVVGVLGLHARAGLTVAEVPRVRLDVAVRIGRGRPVERALVRVALVAEGGGRLLVPRPAGAPLEDDRPHGGAAGRVGRGRLAAVGAGGDGAAAVGDQGGDPAAARADAGAAGGHPGRGGPLRGAGRLVAPVGDGPRAALLDLRVGAGVLGDGRGVAG